jgi:predicted nucleic acid-binding protein
MKAIVDTNVVAYFLLGTEPFVAEARRFLVGVSRPMAPALWEAEIANVIGMATRSDVISPDEGMVRLRLAMRLGIESVPIHTLLQGALLRAVASGVAVYDCVFVELAIREACRLATFDRAVLKAFPDVAVRPRTLPSG